jgi:hypothetical protein
MRHFGVALDEGPFGGHVSLVNYSSGSRIAPRKGLYLGPSWVTFIKVIIYINKTASNGCDYRCRVAEIDFKFYNGRPALWESI